MDDRLEKIIRKFTPGQKIAIYPLSTRYGDILTALAERCETFEHSSVTLEEPFQAEFLGYGGNSITVRTERYPCLKIDASDLENVVPFSTDESKN